MCGILGGYCDESVPKEAIERALNEMEHRGPDDQRYQFFGNAFLGMRRLSIIDLAGGMQPIGNEDESLQVVCNGEIYNFVELVSELKDKGHKFQTSSDVETIVHLYEEHGKDLCSRLYGMFGLALWDKKHKTLLLGRDRFGKKPLFWARTPSGGVLFASELRSLKILLESVAGPCRIREQSIYDYLSLGFIPQPATIYEEIHMLPPGGIMVFGGGEPKIESYWEPNFRVKQVISYEEALEEVRYLLSDAVRIRLRSDVPLGVFLSGGVDSSVVAYEASQHVSHTLRTFTVSVDDVELDEAPVAVRTAKKFGAKIEVLPLDYAPLDELYNVVRAYNQPYSDSSSIPSMAISRAARKHVTVVLTGDGGDEVFAGYRRYLASHLSDMLDWVPKFVPKMTTQIFGQLMNKRRSMLGMAERFSRGLSTSHGERYLLWTPDMILEEAKRSAWLGSSEVRSTERLIDELLPEGLSGCDTHQYTDMKMNMLNDQLVKVDIATMAASLEARSPLLDHRLAEFVMSLPASYRIHNGKLKSLLKDAYQDRVPDEVLQARKRGFEIPMTTWLKEDFRPVMMDTLGSPSGKVREFLDGKFVDGLLDGSILQEKNTTYIKYALLVLELWLRDV